MPDFDSTDRVLIHNLQEAMAKVAFHRKKDATPFLQVIDDLLATDDRVEPVDMVVWLSTEVLPVEPEIGIIDGRDTGLFYRGAVNLLYGTDGCGKTLLMQKLVLQELEAGNEVLFLDAEEGSPRNMVLRLQSMGCPPEYGSRLHYFTLDRPPTEQTRKMFADYAKRCSLVAIDSAGEFMGMYGKDATKDLETRSVLFEMFGRPLAAARANPDDPSSKGPAVVILDHIAKSSDGSMPIGSIRKRAGIDGAAYYLSVDEGNEWSKTHGGYGGLLCTKDRNGTYARGEYVARIQVFPAATSVTGELVVELSYTENDNIRAEDMIDGPPASKPIDLELEVLRICEEYGPLVRNRDILDELNRRMDKPMTRTTFEALVKTMRERGFLKAQDGHLVPLISTLQNHRKND